VDCPLLNVDSDRVTFQVPYATQPGDGSLTVSSPAGLSDAYSLTVSAAGPGIYTSDGAQAIAANADGSVNGPDAPAPAGSTILVGLTGIGSVNPQIGDGQAPPANLVVSAVWLASAQIGGADAPVQSLVLLPGFVGVAQAAIVVPALPSGDYPLVVTVGGVDSMPATVSIAAGAPASTTPTKLRSPRKAIR
jgi:uncharacterized protein (TIGR03437 family)